MGVRYFCGVFLASVLLLILSDKIRAGNALTWQRAKVTKAQEFVVSYGGYQDIYSVTVVDERSAQRSLLNYTSSGEAPLPLGLFVVGDTVQVVTNNGHICRISFQAHELATSESRC